MPIPAEENTQTEANCQLCDANDSADNMVACDKCSLWFHFMCAGFDGSVENHDYVCRPCKESTNTEPNNQFTPAEERPPASSAQMHQTVTPMNQPHGSNSFEQDRQLFEQSSPANQSAAVIKQGQQLSSLTKEIDHLQVVTDQAAGTSSGARLHTVASSKSSKRSTKRLERELQKLDEEHRLNQQYLAKKYQLLNEYTDESSCSDDGNSIDDSGKVQRWMEQTKNPPKMCKPVDGHKSPALLDPDPQVTNVKTPWIGANVYFPLQQQQMQRKCPEQPHCAVKQPIAHSSTLQNQPVFEPPNLKRSSTRQSEVYGPPTAGEQMLANPPVNGTLPHQLQPIANAGIASTHHQQGNAFDVQMHRNGNTAATVSNQTHLRFDERSLLRQPESTSYPGQILMPQTLTRSHLAARQSFLKELPAFDGNPETWPLFISSFERTTQLCGFSGEENLVRLQKALKDQALRSVQSLLLQPKCVTRVISTLRMMFGRPELILTSLLQKIQAAPSPKADKLETLVSFAVAVQNLCATIEASGLVDHLNNPMLLQELVQKLPSPIRLNWALHRQALHTCTLSEFSVWLYDLAEAANYVIVPGLSASPGGVKSTANGRKEKGFLQAHSALASDPRDSTPKTTDPAQRKCFVCDGGCSSMEKCSKFLQLSYSSKWGVVKDSKLCRRCLKRHGRYRCRSEAVCGTNGCIFKHHRLLHNHEKDKPTQASEDQVPVQTSVQPNNAHTDSSNTMLFRIVPVILHGNKVEVNTYAFLDDGSSLTLMDEEIAQRLNVDSKSAPLCLQWTANTHRYEDDSRVLNLHISGTGRGCKKLPLLNVRTVKSLDLMKQTIDAEDLRSKYLHLKNLDIESYDNATPRLLIGLNNWKLGLPLQCKEGNLNEPVATKTRLGWIVHGCNQHVEELQDSVASTFAYTNMHKCDCSRENDDELECLMKEFICADNFGTSSPTSKILSSDDQRALALLQERTHRTNGRFETGLLWKYDQVDLPDSLPMAKRRLRCLQQRLQRDPELAKELHLKIEDYISKGFARKLSPEEASISRSKSWYLPVFPVKNPNKPGKVRLVWDAAAKVGGVCLNSVLLKGPDLLTPLTAVIFKFRERRFAVCADIQEMFHQVRIREQDQNYQRFLWFDKNNNVEEYIMMVMTFGATCSPSCSQYIKNKNAEEFEAEFPRAVKSIRDNHYVDDLMDSVDSEEEAVKLAQEVAFIHQQGGFHIRNWISNSKAVIESLESAPTGEVHLNTKTGLETEKVLGMWWSTQDDHFTFKVSSSTKHQDVLLGAKVPTKRELLRILMKIFDPLGLLANFLMYVKILLQEIWRSGIEWDDPILEPEHTKWLHWIRFLPQLDEIQIPRCYISDAFKTYPEMQLHVFVDASENGFAAVAYARSSLDDTVQCALVAAKTKVAPLKPLSIPRLELQAAVLGVRLANHIVESHSIKFQSRFFWSDSRTVLSWLRSDQRRYRQFVACRVSEILDLSNVQEWRWISTKLNVADEGTKWQGNPNFNASSRWITGPEFLLGAPESWPPDESYGQPTETDLKAQFVGVHSKVSRNIFDPERFQEWFRLLRCAARVLRFSKNMLACIQLKARRPGPLTRHEFRNAECLLLKQAQWDVFAEEVLSLASSGSVAKTSSLVSLCPHLDEQGVLRASSRIEKYVDAYTNDFRRPIILPKLHHITTLIVRDYHNLYHHGNHETVINQLRQKFYISGIRSVLGRVRKGCQRCKNATAKPSPPKMAQLPACRLATFSRPFSYTGIDYFGPMTVINLRRTEKRYGVLLTCLTTRAVHIEVAYSLTTDSCILAIRNFMARRGTPLEFISDNGTNFKGIESELKKASNSVDHNKLMQTFTSVSTKWTFIPPGSPHMGGSWERLVRSIKSVLYQIKPDRHPSDELLRSMLLEVENIINSRPLTYVPIANENEEAITPNHFLLGSSGGSKPWAVLNDDKEVLRRNWLISQRYAQQFWRRWVSEYLPTITRRTKWYLPAKPLQKDDIVVIVDPNNPRNSWPKGRVIETKLSADGQVRSATVATQSGINQRPAVRLAVLDVRRDNKVGPAEDIPEGGVAPEHVHRDTGDTCQ